jgi:1-acyl-sn-glycerol-3-phosphate acyltransferase
MMLITIIWATWFVILMLGTLPFLGLYYIIKLAAGRSPAEKYIHWCTKMWGRITVLSTGSHVTINGSENLSSASSICFVCNHQSMFDIPLVLGWVDRQLGFVAKRELKKVPLLNGWISAIHSVFLDRSNPRAAIVSLNLATKSIRQGNAIVIFPEGTRSKDGDIAEFKPGSLKLATNADAVIQPLTVSGTRLVYEAHKRISRSNLTLNIHPAIYPGDKLYNDKSALVNALHSIISSQPGSMAQTNPS